MAAAAWDDSEHFREQMPILGVLAFSAYPGVSNYLRCYTSILYDLEPNTSLSVTHLLYVVDEGVEQMILTTHSPFNLWFNL